jgi:hypothetical protein
MTIGLRLRLILELFFHEDEGTAIGRNVRYHGKTLHPEECWIFRDAAPRA